METLGNKLDTKTSKQTSNTYVCNECHYKCSKRFNLERHLMSRKHKKDTNCKQLETKNEQNEQTIDKLICESCKKSYTTRSGLWKHKKFCNIENVHDNELSISENSQTNEIQELKEFMKYLMKENSDMKTMMMEVIKNGTTNPPF